MEGKGDVEKLILPEPTHIGYVTRDIERTMGSLQKYFGLGSFKKLAPDYSNRRYHGKPGDFKTQLAFARAGNIVYDMREHGEGMHHLGYEISDLAKWTEGYRKVGIEPIMSGERTGLKWAYFNTPAITVELLERRPEGRVV
jgi:hypothetical protein